MLSHKLPVHLLFKLKHINSGVSLDENQVFT